MKHIDSKVVHDLSTFFLSVAGGLFLALLLHPNISIAPIWTLVWLVLGLVLHILEKYIH